MSKRVIHWLEAEVPGYLEWKVAVEARKCRQPERCARVDREPRVPSPPVPPTPPSSAFAAPSKTFKHPAPLPPKSRPNHVLKLQHYRPHALYILTRALKNNVVRAGKYETLPEPKPVLLEPYSFKTTVHRSSFSRTNYRILFEKESFRFVIYLDISG